MPATQSVNENNGLVFSATNGNLISISDVDANNNAETVTLTVTHGALTLSEVEMCIRDRCQML